MIAAGLFRLLFFTLLRFFKDDLSLIESAKKLRKQGSYSREELQVTFRALRKVISLLPIKNECFVLSLTMFSLCGDGAKLFFGMTPDRIPTVHAWVEWQDSIFTSDFGFQGKVLWTHSK